SVLYNVYSFDYRRDASQGVWSSFLLPAAVVLGQIKCSSSSSVYTTVACIASGLLAHSAVTVLRMYGKLTSSKMYVLPCLISTLLLYFFTPEGFSLSIGYGVICTLAYDRLIVPLMKLCPRSFTYGEATVVLQACVLFVASSLTNVGHYASPCSCLETSTAFIQVAILGVAAIGSMSYGFGMAEYNPKWFYVFTLLIGALMLPIAYFIAGGNPVLWIVRLFFEDILSVQLLGYWLVCSLLGCAAVVYQSKKLQKASTVTRKIFHVLTVIVFIPGIIIKPCLIYLASGIVFALFILIDMVRLLKVPPMYCTLQSGFESFADDKDDGGISLTPLYLLAGCSLPLWVSPTPPADNLLAALAGLLSVGIGDTAASTCGILVGKNKWPGSKKTKEGTAACFLSQLFSVIALIHFGYLPRSNLIKPTFAIAVTSLVEAKTTQVDNLVLPLIMYILTL
ncbi:hypothetical protein AAG570_004115, partial [Ranatra chinensis]